MICDRPSSNGYRRKDRSERYGHTGSDSYKQAVVQIMHMYSDLPLGLRFCYSLAGLYSIIQGVAENHAKSCSVQRKLWGDGQLMVGSILDFVIKDRVNDQVFRIAAVSVGFEPAEQGIQLLSCCVWFTRIQFYTQAQQDMLEIVLKLEAVLLQALDHVILIEIIDVLLFEQETFAALGLGVHDTVIKDINEQIDGQ